MPDKSQWGTNLARHSTQRKLADGERGREIRQGHELVAVHRQRMHSGAKVPASLALK